MGSVLDNRSGDRRTRGNRPLGAGEGAAEFTVIDEVQSAPALLQAHCRHEATITDFGDAIRGGDLLLVGKCATAAAMWRCGSGPVMTARR